jgi:succinate-semialdehyde dehydrogenase/glutarate-semialdehyde dehydrogenase
VQECIYDRFVEGFVRHAKSVKVGDGLDAETTMGLMANPRRIAAMAGFLGDAVQYRHWSLPPLHR